MSKLPRSFIDIASASGGLCLKSTGVLPLDPAGETYVTQTPYGESATLLPNPGYATAESRNR